jgi:hypothetical protein
MPIVKIVINHEDKSLNPNSPFRFGTILVHLLIFAPFRRKKSKAEKILYRSEEKSIEENISN